METQISSCGSRRRLRVASQSPTPIAVTAASPSKPTTRALPSLQCGHFAGLVVAHDDTVRLLPASCGDAPGTDPTAAVAGGAAAPPRLPAVVEVVPGTAAEPPRAPAPALLPRL